jgi:hypothetical protein
VRDPRDLSDECLDMLLDHDGVNPQEITCAQLEALIGELQRHRATQKAATQKAATQLARKIIKDAVLDRIEKNGTWRVNTADIIAIAEQAAAKLTTPGKA